MLKQELVHFNQQKVSLMEEQTKAKALKKLYDTEQRLHNE